MITMCSYGNPKKSGKYVNNNLLVAQMMHFQYQSNLVVPFVMNSIEAACAAHPTADVFINFASYRRLVFFVIKSL